MESPRRAQAHGPALIRLLARISGADTPPPSQSLSARLGQWIDWRQAVALSATLDARHATPPRDDRSHARGDAGECARVRAALVTAIEGDRAFTAEDASAEGALPDYAFFRQRYIAMQQAMEAEIGHLRGRLRGMLARQAPHMDRLAAMDAVMEQTLSRHERALLSALPDLLGKHFERLRRAAPDASTAWPDVFRQDMQSLLLAELDIRLQPTEGLLAALRPTPPGSHAQ